MPRGRAPQIQRANPQCLPKVPAEPPEPYTVPGRIRAEVDIDLVVKEVVKRLKSDPSFRGPAGKDGADGKDGKVSQDHLAAISQALYEQMQRDPKFRGPAGRDGKTPDIAALKNDILKSLPKIRVQVNDAEPVQQDLSKGDALFKFKIDNRFGVRSGT